MNDTLRPALVLFLLLTLVTGVAYPLAVTGIARVAFPAEAGGSLVWRDGKPVGSALIGQTFRSPGYFRGRPSVVEATPGRLAASGGSNLGPANPALVEAVKARIAALHAEDPGNAAPVPVDLVTASASGLDPDISVAGALYQVDRVARARRLAPERVRALVAARQVEPRLGFLGEPRVNVLRLNLDLDLMRPAAP